MAPARGKSETTKRTGNLYLILVMINAVPMLETIPIAPGITMLSVDVASKRPIQLTVVKNGLEGTQSETFEDQRTERSDTARDERDTEHHETEDDGLGVHEAFSDLAPFESLVLSTSVVHSDSLEGDVFVLLGKPLDFGRVSGEDEPGGDGEGERDETDTEEDDLVFMELGALGVTETVRQEGTKDSSHSL